jgi:hypothetical protein
VAVRCIEVVENDEFDANDRARGRPLASNSPPPTPGPSFNAPLNFAASRRMSRLGGSR